MQLRILFLATKSVATCAEQVRIDRPWPRVGSVGTWLHETVVCTA